MDCQFNRVGVYRADYDGIDKTVREYARQTIWKPTEYQEYIRTVPVLFPFIPVYSLKKVRVFLEWVAV